MRSYKKVIMRKEDREDIDKQEANNDKTDTHEDTQNHNEHSISITTKPIPSYNTLSRLASLIRTSTCKPTCQKQPNKF